MATGHITPNEAAEIAKVIDAYMKAYQTAELDLWAFAAGLLIGVFLFS